MLNWQTDDELSVVGFRNEPASKTASGEHSPSAVSEARAKRLELLSASPL